MYKIEVDGSPLYHPLLDEYKILSGKVDLEVNKAGSLTFSIPEDNPHYGLAKLMKSIVTLYDDDKLIFKGRPYAPSRNLFRDNTIICEGSLAFFNDSIQEPFDYFGTVEGLFRQVIERHNAQVDEIKRFKVGRINVVNSTDEGNITRSDIDFKTTWDILREKFFESALGGYLWVRYEEDGTYIDYLSDLNFICNQDVEQSINLMDVKESISCSELATAVIPLGAKVNDVYTTIEDVNNGVKYLYDPDAVAEYGWIFKVVKHDDINDKSILLRAGKQDLADAVGVTTTIEVKASDLSKAGYNVSPFSFGTYVNVIIDNLNIDRKMLIKKLSFDLLKPESSEITAGDEIKSFTNEFSSMVNSNKNDMTQVKSEVETIKLKKGVASSVVKFYLSTSATSLVGGEWTETPPAWVDGSFYWQKVITTYTDGEVKESDPICITGPSGSNGKDGTNGKDGKDAVTYYTWVKYADTPTSGMSDNPNGKKYLGLAYNKTTPTESTNYNDYTWSLIKGEDGSDGNNGTNGVDGKTYYTWVKYADDANGTNMTNDPTGKEYIGLAYNKETPTESTNALDYKWALFKGSDGVDGSDGSDGQGVDSITVQYYLSTSKTTQTGGSWVTTMPTWSSGKYLWIRNKIVYKNPASTVYTTPYCDSSWEAVNDAKTELENDYNSKFDSIDTNILELTQNLTAQISEQSDRITSEVAEKYYTKDEAELLASEVSTQITQTKNSVDIQFTNYQADLDGLREGTNAEFEEIKKMIRLVDGKIILGIAGNPLELYIQNDRIYFAQNGLEVAYFSDSKLYITDAEILASLRIGKFAYIPRSNGSLDFKKVGD